MTFLSVQIKTFIIWEMRAELPVISPRLEKKRHQCFVH